MTSPTREQVQGAMNALGHEVFDGVAKDGSRKNHDLNIFGVRSANAQPNRFDDWLGVFWMDWDAGGWAYRVWPATTDPGTYWMRNYDNSKGVAILVPGQYPSSHKLGTHKGYEALQQISPVKVYRDANKDTRHDTAGATIDTGIFGINIHRANALRASIQVDKWSAGCQVIADPSHFAELMDLCREAKALWGNTFTYTLLKEEDLA